jgi:hypothetical protein
MIVETVDPHLRHRQDVDCLGEGNRAAGVGVAGKQGLEAGLGELGLEVARDLQDRGTGIGPIGDPDDAPSSRRASAGWPSLKAAACIRAASKSFTT